MTTGQWIVADDVVALLSVAGWFAAGVTLALRRARPARVLLAVAVLVTLTRVATVVVLTGRGWWFAQEKVLLGLPMLGAAGLVAVLITGRDLFAARRVPGETWPVRGTVSVLTAAYAALAGLGVTFLVGYPLTWGTALIAISLVCVGALLTARVLATPVKNPPERGGMSRRRFIGLTGGAIVVSTAGTGVGLAFLPAEPVTTGGGPGWSSRAAVPVTGLRGPDAPAPGGTRRQHVLTARRTTVRLPSGRDIDALTYNGELPGPAITATLGDLIEVRLRNADVEDGVTLHWHGYDVPCGEDGAPGVTQDAVAPNADFVYRFRADQAGTYWYHTHHASHVGVRKGLYGTLVVKPRAAEEQLDLTLPVHTFDDTVVVAGSDGRTEHTAPAGTRVRLRLVNTDSDPHRFTLAGTPFRVAAVDGRDLNQPDAVSGVGLRLPAGGRYDLTFVMPDRSVALVLDNDRDGGLWLSPHTGADPPAEDTSNWPELDLLHYGSPASVAFDADRADRHFTLVLDRGLAVVDGRPAYAHTVNGRGHPSIPDQLVAHGEIIRFTVVNRSLATHPWHLHGHSVLVLSRAGIRSSGSPLWMDTFDVRPGEVWEVAFQAVNPGIWMNHCHNLPHAHQGMMLRLRYDGVTTPLDGSHPGNPSHGH
ncbi:MAG: multicopper oxidase domain-containing protein [Labedaea sp.]